MAKHLDLEEQEQLDELKHFWKTYGNLITWVLIAVFGSIAAWNGYQYWQRSQAIQAAAMYDEIDRAAAAGDLQRLERATADIKDKYSRTTYASQGVMLGARVFQENAKPDLAKQALQWVVDSTPDAAYAAIARLRLAGLAMETKAYDEALKILEKPFPTEFEALVEDRRGDVANLQGSRERAVTHYQKAFRLFDERSEYRRLVEIKLNALGVEPAAVPATKGA
ncbi:MAG: tetratricopeptide repeat protein [Burkholderiaceae bacterium]|nr:tetratricopeptide repeat protein [Burkholderiaceae bacterium]